MSKKVLQDITSRTGNMNKKKFTRKWDYSSGDGGIVNTEKSKHEKQSDVAEDEVDDLFEDIDEIDETEGNREEQNNDRTYFNDDDTEDPQAQEYKKRGIWIGVSAVVVALFFFISNLFASATVDVVLLQQTVSIQDKEFTVEKGAIDHTFQMQILPGTQSINIPAVNEESVYEKASGQIVIYNEYSTSPQRLVTNTRFQSPEGYVYRISEAIIIPGYTKDGTDVIPGSIEVYVTADQPGDEYNATLKDFTIPGLKDTDLYEKVYARSKTSMSGGYAGVLRTAKPEDVNKAKSDLEKMLRDSLMEQLKSSIGTDKVLYNDAIFTQFESKTLNADDVANVTVEGHLKLYAVLFSRNDLSSFIAEEMLSSYDGASVIDTNIENLTFIVKDKDSFDFVYDDTLTFLLSGQSHLVWNIDEETLKNELAGSKFTGDDFANIVKKHPSIRKADPKVSPFWKRTFPKDPTDITILQVSE